MNLKSKTLVIDMKNAVIFIGSILLCESLLIFYKLSINENSLIWYKYLFKPAFTPSFLVFGGIWIIMSLLTGTSLYLVLKSEKNQGSKKHAFIVFGIQLILNALLIPVFLGLKSTLGGFAAAILLCLSMFITFYKFYKINIIAAFLLIPPVLWASYILGLNFTFWIYNH